MKDIEDEKAKLAEFKKNKSQFDTQSQMALATLSELSEKLLGKGFVEFFGCSRCRYSRLGCINCNPKERRTKFPNVRAACSEGEAEQQQKVADAAVTDEVGKGFVQLASHSVT